ncbi:MAG TPA: glycosyltransferase family 1 protein [Methylothermaceae bacterium]|nr:glycosyltransferase family 1 protein [Methylothermaceae bacterium]
MRIAIVHYHLRPGGVTRVIEQTARLLHQAGHQVVVLAQEEVQGFPVPVCPVPQLAYDEDREPVAFTELKAALLEAVHSVLGDLPEVWHFHNHHLGKNLALPRVVAELARRGQRLLLQIHDFPEDFRPYNYRRLKQYLPEPAFPHCLYPNAPQVHYAVLNGRDRRFLRRLGVPRERLHWLPNPVGLPPEPETSPSWPARLWLYPTRAIRRKNLGEFLLWAALAGPEDHFATSLAPENPREQVFYRHWVDLAQSLKLPVTFDLAKSSGLTFTAMVQAAHCLVTTSVAEGFGMAFLEPWVLGKPVTGRNLPEITVDFEAAGIDLSHMYARLDVPVAWLGRAAIWERMTAALSRLYRDYGLRAPGADQFQRVWRAWVTDDRVDFGRLDEPLQSRAIRHLHADAKIRRQWGQCLQVPSRDTVRRNRRKVTEGFAPERYGRALDRCYQQLAAAGIGPLEPLDPDQMLRCFLRPERLSLLRL